MQHGPKERTAGTRASGRLAQPAVVVHYHSHPGSHDELRQVHAGLEEEGVHVRIEERPDRGDEGAVELAYAAACASTLAVGVGLDANGTICVHHAKLPPSSPFLTRDQASGTTLRWIGHNAARTVKGMPLKPATRESERTSRRHRTR